MRVVTSYRWPFESAHAIDARERGAASDSLARTDSNRDRVEEASAVWSPRARICPRTTLWWNGNPSMFEPVEQVEPPKQRSIRGEEMSERHGGRQDARTT